LRVCQFRHSRTGCLHHTYFAARFAIPGAPPVLLETTRFEVDNIERDGIRRFTKGQLVILQQSDPILVIRQTDHAFLSGFFAREWGNEIFIRPEPFSSFCLAASEHDNGWQEWELSPGTDPRTYSPYSFMTVPTEQHVSLYQRGIDRTLKVDMYAGLMVVSHCMGLYDRSRATMPGYSAKYVSTQEQHLANDFVQRLRLQQLRLKVDLRNDPTTKEFSDEKRIKANIQRLEALDRLSLYFCLGNAEDASIENVPVNDDGQEVDWEVRPVGQDRFTIHPYPFRRDPLEFAILARRIPKRRYADDAELQSILSAAPFFNIRFTLRSRSAANTSFALSA
jgi:hypothetical protein